MYTVGPAHNCTRVVKGICALKLEFHLKSRFDDLEVVSGFFCCWGSSGSWGSGFFDSNNWGSGFFSWGGSCFFSGCGFGSWGFSYNSEGVSWLRLVCWGWVVYSGLMVNWGWVVYSGFVVYWGGFVVYWGWGGFVVYWFWGGFVSWFWEGFVGWGGVGLWFVFWVSGFSFVFDIGNIAIWASGVGDDLDTAIGKVYTVFSLCVVVVSVFAVGESGAGIGITDTVLEVVYWCGNWLMVWGWGWSMVWCWGCWGSGSTCNHSGGYEDLK